MRLVRVSGVYGIFLKWVVLKTIAFSFPFSTFGLWECEKERKIEMALETVVYAQDLFSYGCKDLYSLAAALSYDFKAEEQEEEEEKEGALESGMSFPLVRNQELGRVLDGLNGNWDSSSSSMVQNFKEWDVNSSPEACTPDGFLGGSFPAAAATTPGPGRRKRRRAKSCKNKEEVENQRMTHIAVERNRRKQMNEYLAMLRSLMPPSYVQRVCLSLSLSTIFQKYNIFTNWFQIVQ